MAPESSSPRLRWLNFRTGVVASIAVIGALAIAAFTKANQNPHFKEIDVERINVREPDGTLRMTISNAARSPGWVFKGKLYPGRPKGAGMIFFNDEGEEDGGFGFGGRTGKDGKVHASGGLAFDQYNQDETVTLRYSQEGNRRQSGLIVNDRATNVPISLMLAKRDSINKLPEGPVRDSAMKAFVYNNGQPIKAQRLFAGREPNNNSVVSLADPQGHTRLRMVVDSTGLASIQFLDTEGHVTRTISATDTQ